MNKIINQYEPLIGPTEIAAVNEYMNSGGWLTEFKKTTLFAEEIGKVTGSKYSFILANGTVTLTAALVAYGIKAGDEVLVPDLTMVASATSAKILGATVVFVDIERETLCIDYEDVLKKTTNKTKALILVSLNGRYPSKVEKLIAFCKEKSIVIIEDAAQSLGSYYKGKHIGTYGDIGSFSFSMPKIITTGQGGALITDDPVTSDKIAKIRDFGREKPGADHYLSIGWNFKFTDVQAVIGLAQLESLNERIEKKRNLFDLYRNCLEHLEEVTFIETDLSQSTPWFIDVLVEDRDKLIDYLEINGIKSRKFYPSLHSEPAFEGYEGLFPNTDFVTSRGLWLPSSFTLSDDDVKCICNTIIDFYTMQRTGHGG